MRTREAHAKLRAAAGKLADRLLAAPDTPVTVHFGTADADYARILIRRVVGEHGYRLSTECIAPHRDRAAMRQENRPGPYRFRLAVAT